MSQFKENYTLEERQELFRQYQNKFPTHVPVIAEKYCKSKLTYQGKVRYLIRQELTLTSLKAEIKASLQMSHEALFIFCGKTMINEYETLESLYLKYKDPIDGFLYIEYSNTNPFG